MLPMRMPRLAEISTVSAFSRPWITALPVRWTLSASTPPDTLAPPEQCSRPQWISPASRPPDTSTSPPSRLPSNFSAPELWTRPLARRLPSHRVEPEQPSSWQVMSPVTRLPLHRISPAQSTSPWTLALPEQRRLSQRRLPWTLPDPLMETVRYSPPGMALLPEIFISMMSFIM